VHSFVFSKLHKRRSTATRTTTKRRRRSTIAKRGRNGRMANCVDGETQRLRRYGTRHRWRGAAPRRRRSASKAARATATDVFEEDPVKDQSDKNPMPYTHHTIIHTFNRIHINANTNSDVNTYRDVTAAMNHSRCRLSAMRGGVIVRRGNNTSHSCLMQYT
jgi:hypothetical protein